MIENSSKYVEFLKNKMGEMMAGAYLLYMAEIVNRDQQIGTGALLIVSDYILGLV